MQSPSHPESTNLTPRSRSGSWTEEPSNSTATKIRLMCSYGGKIAPRPHDKTLCYLNGDTRIVAIDKNNFSLADLVAKIDRSLPSTHPRPFVLKYQLPSEDLDSLISVTTDEDLENMIDEYDRIAEMSGNDLKPRRIRLFIFSDKKKKVGEEPEVENWFVEGLNNGGIMHKSTDSHGSSINYLLGLEEDDRSLNPSNNNHSSCSSAVTETIAMSTTPTLPAPPRQVDHFSSFDSSSSSPSSNLPPIKVRVDDNQNQRAGLEEGFAQMGIHSQQKSDENFGGMKQTGVNLRYMMDFGKNPTQQNLLVSSQFLHRELAVRIARRVIDLECLPFGLSSKPAVLKVRDWYLDSFRDLRVFPEIKDADDEIAFTKMIKLIKVRHNNVVPAMAMGVKQLKKDLYPGNFSSDPQEIHEFLDRFYMSRIGIRMLIGQHVALHDPNPEPGCIGHINTKMSPMLVAQNASEDARAICLREYGSAPDVKIYGDSQFTFPYVPSHLHLMVFELVKNSLRAVQERFMNSDKAEPCIRIIVADGIEDVTIKISDEGGGVRRSGLPKIFTYLYSTAEKLEYDDVLHGGADDGVSMAGYGYGLPISRLYARYFGGDLQIISMEGYGTDAYLHLSRLGDSQEPLP